MSHVLSFGLFFNSQLLYFSHSYQPFSLRLTKKKQNLNPISFFSRLDGTLMMIFDHINIIIYLICFSSVGRIANYKLLAIQIHIYGFPDGYMRSVVSDSHNKSCVVNTKTWLDDFCMQHM